MAEPADVIGTAERVSFEDFAAASGARLFAAALAQCGQDQAEAGELLAGALTRARRRWARISRSADPEARVRQMLTGRPAARRRLAASRGREESGRSPGTATPAAGPPPAGLMMAVAHRHRRYQRRLRAGCVAGVAVLALALALALLAHRLSGRAANPASTPGRVASCVDAPTHEAQMLCVRYAGPVAPPAAVTGRRRGRSVHG